MSTLLSSLPVTSSEAAESKNKVSFSSFVYEGRDRVWEANPPRPGEFYNPVRAGFYADPCVCRAGNDFYLINSSFSFFPGVPISHSTDLVNWKTIGYVLDRPSQLPLDGQTVSEGIFAPAISYHDGLFYMVTTNIAGMGNFYVTAKNPAGPWSEPIPLPRIQGIDPSFFFDSDGRAYLVHNGNPPENKALYEGHRAVWLWEFDYKAGKIIGEGKIIVNGGVDISKKPIWIEGPHIFKRGDYYYLSAAEGGTGPDHSQVIFRSKDVQGPYVPFEGNPILTQRDLDPNRPNPITCVGHADLIEAPNGQWWAVFLAVRPYEGGKSNIGRETFLLPVRWENDWPLILDKGETLPTVLPRPALPSGPSLTTPATGSFTWRADFDASALDIEWSFLRNPRQQWWSLENGSLSIEPRPFPLYSVRGNRSANGNPSFIARRQQHADFSASTTMTLHDSRGQAGIAALQNDSNYLFLGVNTTENGQRSVFLERYDRGLARAGQGANTVVEAPLPQETNIIELKMTGEGKHYSFFYRLGKGDWLSLQKDVDGSLLSTELAGGFVGTFIGMFARSTA